MKRYHTIDPFCERPIHLFRYTRKDKLHEFGGLSGYFVHALKDAKEWLKRKRS